MGQKLTMKEQMRRNHRAVKKAVREVEREHKALERNQKKLVADIKKLAKQGQMNAVKIMAKDLVRNKRFCTKMLEMRSQVSHVVTYLVIAKRCQALPSVAKRCKALQSVGRWIGRCVSTVYPGRGAFVVVVVVVVVCCCCRCCRLQRVLRG